MNFLVLKMKKFILIIAYISALFLSGCYTIEIPTSTHPETYPTGNSEINSAFFYLNKIRANPSGYITEINAFNLSHTVLLTEINYGNSMPLHWNDRLALSAQRKAEDMAVNNYFAHVYNGKGPVHWITEAGYHPSGYGESLAGGYNTGKKNILALIDDATESPTYGHRVHLLSLSESMKRHVDIGIGYAYHASSTYKWYFVVHTAY